MKKLFLLLLLLGCFHNLDSRYPLIVKKVEVIDDWSKCTLSAHGLTTGYDLSLYFATEIPPYQVGDTLEIIKK